MRRLGWILLAVVSAAVASAQGSGEVGTDPEGGSLLRFRHLTIDDGLSQNAIAVIEQDRDGFLWIGTKDGLNRFDGYEFVVYRHDPFDANTLSSSYVTALLETEAGEFWIGTRDRGLNRLDRDTGTIVRYENSPQKPISALVEDREGNVWGATLGGGVFRLDGDATRTPEAPVTRFAHPAGTPNTVDSGNVTSLLVDSQGTIWAGTMGGLHRYDPVHDRFAPYTDQPTTALAEAGDGSLWVGTVAIPSAGTRASAYLGRVDDPGGQGEVPRVTYVPYPDLARSPGWERIGDIQEGPDGALWLATPAGVARFDRATNEFTFYRHDPGALLSLSGDHTTDVLWDRGGILWVGTNGFGVDRHDARRAQFSLIARRPDPSSRISGFSVRSIFEDASGDVWIGAGVPYRLDRATGALVSYEAAATGREFGVGEVWAMAQDREGVLWFGTDDGLFRYDSAGRARRYVDAEGKPDWLPEREKSQGSLKENRFHRVYDIHRDQAGTLWIVTGRYLARLDDPEAGRFTTFLHTPDSLYTGYLLFPSLVEDTQGRFWFGTETGLVRFDPASGDVGRYRTIPGDPTSLSSDRVRSISRDPEQGDQVLWIGTDGGGLNRFDVEAGTFTHVTTEHGLPNNVVYGVLPDDAGRLWLSTNEGIARYEPASGSFRTFDVRDGLQSNEFNSGAYHRSADGRLYFGGIQGVNGFDPSALLDNSHAPPVHLTALHVSGRRVAVGDSTGILSRALGTVDELRLSHRQNAFAFTFAALDFSAPEKNLYSYSLEGFDARWSEAGTDRMATYTNVPPGRYTFRVRAANNDGVWNEEGVALRVVVVPPWWQTAWAYALYGLLALSVGVTVARYRRGRLELRHRLEIEHLEAEQLRELDRARSRFFANVSHEFRTPLTLTIGPLDEVREGHHGPVPEAMDEPLALARRNAERVLGLVNQILDVARLEAGHLDLQARPLDLGAFTTGLVRAFASHAESHALTLDVRAPETAVVVSADPEHLETVVVNLVSNAIKFTPEAGRVLVAIESDESAGVARIVVRDSGPGIPPADLPHVFDRFYRVDETAHQVGTGIGLALAKELADLHGGTLSVESEVGAGSTFTLTLPLGHNVLPPDVGHVTGPLRSGAEGLDRSPGGDGAVRSPQAPLGSAVGPEAEAVDRTTVLVVDDHAEVRAYVRRHLERSRPPYRVIEAEDGEAGLATAREALPDLVLTDAMMPGEIDGFALCRAIKADPETDFLPVVLLTARAAPEDRLGGLEAQADDYLTKPFDPRELRARVANLIEGRKRLRERFRQEGMALVAKPDVPTSLRDLPAALRPAPLAAPSADEVLLASVRAAIEANLTDEDFSVDRLAASVGLSRSQLYRRLRAAAGKSTSEVIRFIRLERAAQLLAARAGTVSEVAYAVGFKSVAHFSNAFADHYGCRPSVYPEGATERSMAGP